MVTTVTISEKANVNRMNHPRTKAFVWGAAALASNCIGYGLGAARSHKIRAAYLFERFLEVCQQSGNVDEMDRLKQKIHRAVYNNAIPLFEKAIRNTKSDFKRSQLYAELGECYLLHLSVVNSPERARKEFENAISALDQPLSKTAMRAYCVSLIVDYAEKLGRAASITGLDDAKKRVTVRFLLDRCGLCYSTATELETDRNDKADYAVRAFEAHILGGDPKRIFEAAKTAVNYAETERDRNNLIVQAVIRITDISSRMDPNSTDYETCDGYVAQLYQLRLPRADGEALATA